MNSSLPRLTTLLFLIAAAALTAIQLRSVPANAQVSPPEQPPANAFPAAEPSPNASSGSSHSTAGDKLLTQVAAQLDRRPSVSARLRHQAFIGPDPLYGVGSYWQQGSGIDLKVRLELQIAGQEATLLQVSNSRFLWVDRQLPTGRTVSRIDLRQLRADPVLSATAADPLEPGEANWSSLQPQLISHSGGLPSLLASLSECFSFLPPQAMRLAAQSPSESQPASIPVFAVVGRWKPARFAELLGKKPQSAETQPEAEAPQIASAPGWLPQEVLLIVGQADLFPYRIEYRRLETPLTAGGDAATIPYQLSAHPLVVLELTDVAFDVPIAAGQFDYAPGDADWVDQTATVLERLHRDRQTRIASRDQASPNTLPSR